MLRELCQRGYAIDHSALNQLLSRMVRRGYLKLGPTRAGTDQQRYFITARGHSALVGARMRVRDLRSELSSTRGWGLNLNAC